MWIEAWVLNDEEKKEKKLSEKEVKKYFLKTIEYKKVKEKNSVEIESEEKLTNLKELVEKGIISKDTAEQIIEWEEIWEETIKEIFEKINEIEEIKNIDKYIPKELRITKEDYSKALTDDIFRVQLLKKLNLSLTLIANKINPDSPMWLNLFSWFLIVLDKNLVVIQENTIDIKENLVWINEKKFENKKDNISTWKKIKDYFTELNK